MAEAKSAWTIEVLERFLESPDHKGHEASLGRQLVAYMRDNERLNEICSDPRFVLQVGDQILCGESVCTVQRIDGDKAWFEGTHLGESPFGALSKGWCRRTGAARIIRRDGAAFHMPAAFLGKTTA